MYIKKYYHHDFLIFKVKCNAPKVSDDSQANLKSMRTINLSFLIYFGNRSSIHHLDTNTSLTSNMEPAETLIAASSSSTYSTVLLPKETSTPCVSTKKGDYTEYIRTDAPPAKFTNPSSTDGTPIVEKEDYNITTKSDDKINGTEPPILGGVHQVTLVPEVHIGESINHLNVNTNPMTLNDIVGSTISNRPNNTYKPCDSHDKWLLMVDNDIKLKVFLNSKVIIDRTFSVDNETDTPITDNKDGGLIFDED